MTVKEFYDSLGGDYEDALGRLMNDNMIRRFIRKFPNDKSYGELKAAFENNDVEAAFSAAHTLKGVTANLGFVKLHKAACELTELLRPKQGMPAEEKFKLVRDCYEEVIAALEKVED